MTDDWDSSAELPRVEPFMEELLADQRALALKVLEEASEVHGAWQNVFEHNNDEDLWDWTDVLDECMDVVQATVNLAYALVLENATRGEQNLDAVERELHNAYVRVYRKNDELWRYHR